MVPMRDGVHLQTAVITKADQTEPLPFLITRTPYGVLTQEDFDKNAAKKAPIGSPPTGKNSLPTATSSSCKIYAAASNPKASSNFLRAWTSTMPRM